MGYLDIVNITSLFPLSKAWFAKVLRFPLCRFENFKNASELKPVNVDAKAGEAGYDPFSRRWTRSQNYYQSDRPKTEKEATADGNN
jgi:hypothetical protein